MVLVSLSEELNVVAQREGSACLAIASRRTLAPQPTVGGMRQGAFQGASHVRWVGLLVQQKEGKGEGGGSWGSACFDCGVGGGR